MARILRNKTYRKIFWILIFITVVALSIYAALQGRQYFRRRNIRILERGISPYGSLSPLVIIGLIFLSNVIPPLPLPVPLLEIAGGFIFGFWPGVILAWISQTMSSLFVFGVSRFFGKRYFQKFFNNGILRLYRQYIHEKGPLGVFVVRATMANPFNVISFLPGLNQMSITSFSFSTALGVIPEAILFSYIGFILKNTQIRIWYVFTLIVAIAAMGPLLTLLMFKYLRPKKKRR